MELEDYVRNIFNERNYQLARSIDYSKTHPWFVPFTKDLPSVLKRLVNRLEESEPLKDRYVYEGSIGAGKLADIFWFGFRHPKLAPSWQEGFYIVYLLSNDGKRLYLSLILGTEIVFSQAELEKKALELQSAKDQVLNALRNDAMGVDGLDLQPFNFGQVSFGGSSNLARAYEIANIFSIKYDSEVQIPSEEQLENDLGKFLAVYKRCVTLFQEYVPNCR